MLGALAGLIVAAAGSGGPSLISRRVALITAALGLVLTAIAFATGGRPVWAAVAMAAVAVLTSLGAAAGPLGAVLGFLLSLAYLLVALMARTANLFELVSFRWAAAHIAVGCLAGLLVVLVGTAWRRRIEPEDRVQPALPRVRWRPHDDRLRPARRRAHRRDRRLRGAPRARHGHRLRDRIGRDVPSLAGTTRPTSRSRSRPSRQRRPAAADGTRDIDRPCRRSRACRRARCCPSAGLR